MIREGTASEFSRIRNLPHVEVRHMPGKRVSTVQLTYCGRDVGCKVSQFKRGKLSGETFQVEGDIIAMTPGEETMDQWYLK